MRLSPRKGEGRSLAELGVVGSVRSFLGAVECSSLQELEDLLDDRLEPAFVQVRGIGRFACGGVDVQVGGRGTTHEFPFALAEFWSAIDLLELEAESESACEELAFEISDVEGLGLWVVVTYDVDWTLIKPRHKRMDLDNGVTVQFPAAYPYRSRIDGRRTFAEWRASRFDRHYPGLEACLLPPHDETPVTTPIEALRD